ncbi:MAG: hypothetical protein DRI32_07270 [Chloroflexi bacterium]|nr:MAG: hypothetical protein DRI32_07270 [Chloroflexota bacterium]
MKDVQELINEKFKNEKFLREYYKTATFFRLADDFLLLRKQKGLTQTELANLAGTTQTVISRLENASVKPSLETIIKIAEAMDSIVDVHLVSFDEVRRKNNQEKPIKADKRRALKGISLFGAEKYEGEKWVDVKHFAVNHPSLDVSSKPSLTPSSRKKILEYA